MVDVLFTATIAAADQDEQCNVVAVGNEAQYLELQRSPGGLYVEVARQAAADGEPVGTHSGIEGITLDAKRLELRLDEDGSRQLGTERRIHIPLRLSLEETTLLREKLREITADLIAFDEALSAAA
jgi:hypothetical protein